MNESSIFCNVSINTSCDITSYERLTNVLLVQVFDNNKNIESPQTDGQASLCCPLGEGAKVHQQLSKYIVKSEQRLHLYVNVSQQFLFSLRGSPHIALSGCYKDITHVSMCQKPQEPKFDLQHPSSVIVKLSYLHSRGKRDGKSISCHLVQLQTFLFLFFISNLLKDGVLFDFFFVMECTA